MKGIQPRLWTAGILAWAALLAPLPAPAAAPLPPNVSFTEGTALVSLARSAMTEYLRRRTPADRQSVPPALGALQDKPYAAAVLLRERGRLVSREVESDADLPRNVLAAALRAMRSVRMPDHVTQAYLDSLALEVEVLGGPRPLRQEDLRISLTPGATGLLASRGRRSVHVLPSSVVLEGFHADTMRRACLSRLGLQREDVTQPLQWAVFSSRHFVGYPNGRVVQLWRGKRPLPRQAVDEPTLAAAAQRMALYLVSHQAADGQYQAGRLARDDAPTPTSAPATPTSAPAPLPPATDHLYATWALARLAPSATPAEQKVIRASLARAIEPAMANVRTDPKTRAAYVATIDPNDQFEATAWLALILAEMPPPPATAPAGPSLAMLQKALLDSVTDRGRLRACLAPTGPPTTTPDAPSLRAAAVGYMALQRTTALVKPPAEKADALARAVVNRALLTSGRADVLTALWWSRTSLKLTSARPGAPMAATFFPAPMPIALAGKPLPDEIGGFATPGAEPTTEITAMTALQLRRRLADKALTPAERSLLQGQLLEARRFCYLMAFQPHEAYFAADPATWVGAVRQRPSTAEVTLRSCAAAIEALAPAR